MQKVLIVIGLILVVAGLAWPWLGTLPVGRLPGDIMIRRENFTFYFPLGTMILVSVVISFLIWFFRQ